MSDEVGRLIAILEERSTELQQLAEDARDLLEVHLSKDTQDLASSRRNYHL